MSLDGCVRSLSHATAEGPGATPASSGNAARSAEEITRGRRSSRRRHLRQLHYYRTTPPRRARSRRRPPVWREHRRKVQDLLHRICDILPAMVYAYFIHTRIMNG
ncbi:protein of unknown function [Azospirillum lipoferum 4B]|uniref:Uncharacterized protein n=1 Tax=Azospirillum lipoferum (strain 4B) TaxID=862719 RepID=G7Z8R9_AZOL4|nr:protein of unknown function [Azospirillum lipoferum 4B]